MEFEVRGVDALQGVQSLRLRATDPADARRQAMAGGLTPLSITPARAPARPPDTGLLIEQLHGLLRAGLTAIEAVEAVLERHAREDGSAPALRHIATRLREGATLSQALADLHSDPVLIGVVRAAEGTGDVPAALRRYLQHQQRLDALRQQVLSALLYPTILVGVGLAVTLFLMAYVVPRFAQVIQGSGRPLPWASQLLLDLGLFMSAHAAVLGPLALATLGAAGWAWRRAARERRWPAWLARTPGLGPRLRTLSLARCYLTLGLLLDGGIPIQTALGLSGQALGSALQDALARAAAQVATGSRLSAALDAHGLCTAVALRLLQAGEHTGQLGTMLARAAEFHDAEAARWIERFSKAFEPLLMALIGLVIGAVVVLLYLPIFDLASSIG